MFLFWRFSKFFKFFEKKFSFFDLLNLLTSRKFSFLLLCVLFVMFKSNRRLRIFLKSRRSLIFCRVFVLIYVLKSRRFLIFRRVFFCFVFERLSWLFFFASISSSKIRRFLFSKFFQKEFCISFNFSINLKKENIKHLSNFWKFRVRQREFLNFSQFSFDSNYDLVLARVVVLHRE